MNTEQVNVCKACNATGHGKYCSNCGQKMHVQRLSIPAILHEVFHFFTHVDKGFLYTLKRLVAHPGTMELEYIQGNRVRYQKPFSMFFISASIYALITYWVHYTLIHYFNTGDNTEAVFFHQYWVLLQITMMPLYAFITYLFFIRSGYNFGEILVLQLYSLSFMFLAIGLLQLLKLLVHDFQTRYIEVPLAMFYAIATNLFFFTRIKKPLVVLLSIVSIACIFLLAAFVQDKLITTLK